MRGDFSRGAGYLLKGIVYFYRTPSLWSCALIPFLMTLLLYGVLFLAAVRYGIPFCLDLLPDPEGHGVWGRWLLYPLRFLLAPLPLALLPVLRSLLSRFPFHPARESLLFFFFVKILDDLTHVLHQRDHLAVLHAGRTDDHQLSLFII